MDEQVHDSETRVSFWLDDQTVDALEMTLEHLRRAPSRPMSWKWVIIGIHTALHGCFGLALRRSDGAQLHIPKQETKIYKRWERERARGVPEVDAFNPRIDLFLDLFEKVQAANRMNYLGGRPLEPTDQQKESVEHLDFLRGRLTHFSHIGLVVDVRTVLDLLSDALEIVDFLLNKAQPVGLLHEEADRGNDQIGAIRSEVVLITARLQTPS
jgi:hypothetical protein